MLNSDLELKIRIIKGEFRENQKEKEKSLNSVIGVMGCFVSLIVGSIYFFVIKRECETWSIFFVVLIGLVALFLGYYWCSRYKSASKKIKKLQKELARLKKGLKEE